MYNESELYRLSVISPKGKQRTKPQLVFTIKEGHLEEVQKRLRHIAEEALDYAERYCYPGAEFAHFTSDLFGRIAFGYGQCGSCTVANGEAHLHIELRSGMQLYCATLTIHLLTEALAVPPENAPLSNEAQQIDILTTCEHRDCYGHAVTGYISSRMITWLRKQGCRASDGGAVSIPKEAVQAMQDTWACISKDGYEKWAEACRGLIRPDGRFILECFGNACDIAIYPDGGNTMEGSYVSFGCHNLDHADQQVTLLVGLAKMCELAREAEKEHHPDL